MKRRSVYVPVVRLRGRPGDPVETGVCTLWCEQAPVGEPPRDVPSDADKRLAPVAAPLLNAQLFESGCVAAMAVRKLGLAPAPLAVWQRLRPHAWLEARRLFAADAIPRLGHSAELGLALALLLPSARYTGVVMASGSLSGESRQLRDRDVAVHPVGDLGQKLGELLDRCPALLAGARGGLCFTPLTDDQGRPVAELAVFERLCEQGIEVVPIGWLSEAVTRLSCGRVPFLLADRIILAAVVTLGLGLVAGGAAWLWRDYPIPLAFERGGGQAAAREPYLACITADGRHTVPRPIPRQGPIPLLGSDQKLAWTVRVGTPGAWDARLLRAFGAAGYHLLFAVVSADGRRVLADQTPAGGGQASSPAYGAAPGEPWEQWLQIPQDLGEGESALVILARRDRGFDAAALDRGLDALAGPSHGADFVNRAVNYLRSQAPGFLVYQFGRSSQVPDACQD